MKKKISKIKKFSESRKTDSTLFDLINKYDELRSIANAIYNSDYYMIATKKEQKEIEAAAVCISKALVSAIGLEAINHNFLPDDSGNGDDRSWGDNLPDDSGNGADTDKDAHDAIKKIMNIAYGKTKADGMTKAAARRTLNSMYGVLGSHDASNAEVEFSHTPYKSRHINDRATHIMAMNRKILSELGAKSPVDVLDKYPDAFGNDYDGDTKDDSDGNEVKDNSEIDFGNFADGLFYSQRYLDICRQYGFDTGKTLKQIEKVASQYHIQMINLVDIVDDRYQIKPDGKYDLKPGDVFFVINKKNCKNPFFLLIYAKSFIESNDFDIDLVSTEIIPVKSEESTKEESVDSNDHDLNEVKDFSEVKLGNFFEGPLYAQRYRALAIQYGFDMDNTLRQIEKLASLYYIQMINLVDIVDGQDEITADKYTLEPGSVFFVTNKNDSSKSPVFVLIYMQPYTKTRSFDISRFSFEIAPAEVEESTKTNYVELIDPDFYFHIGRANPNNAIDLNATLDKIKDEARTCGISSITFAGTLEYGLDIYDGKYSLKPGSLFYINDGPNMTNFLLVTEVGDTQDATRVQFIESIMKQEENASLDDIEFIGSNAYYSIDNTNPNHTIDLDATLIRIKEKAKEKGIKTITFVDTVKEHSDIYTKGKYSLEPGSIFFIKEGYPRFVLFNDTPTTFYYIDPVVVFKTDDSDEDSSDSNYESGSHDIVDSEVKFEYTPYESRYINDLATSFMAKDDIKFIGIDDYYKLDKSYSKSTIIDLDATLATIKERARAKNIKTIMFVGIIKGLHEAYYKGNNSQVGSLYYLKNDERPMFILITGNIDYVNLPQDERIDPVVIKKNDPEDESDSVKE